MCYYLFIPPQIDGDPLTGLCVVGRVNVWVRVGLLVLPLTVFLAVTAVYVGRLMHAFTQLRARFSGSPFQPDQDMAVRLSRCTYSYGQWSSVTSSYLFV